MPPLSHQNQGVSLVYHPQLVAVYHQCVALYIIKPQERYTLTSDDIQPKGLMRYTLKRDDIPNLRLDKKILQKR